MISFRQAASRPVSLTRRALSRSRLGAVYERYRTATMIPRPIYIDNLELSAQVLKLPLGHAAVVECGTWRGGMSAGLIETLGKQRPYHFFDSFEGLPPAQPVDGEGAIRWQQDKTSPTYFDNCSASELQFRQTINRTGLADARLHVHRGFFESTVPAVDPGPIALLRLDGDWYESTMCCLRSLFPKVQPGGLVIIDDYGTWDGCTRAVHDYLSAQTRPEPIERFGATGVPFIRVRAMS